jgi:hypothetical protein
MTHGSSVALCHNLDPDAFLWLWMKYVRGLNDRQHCTNCLRGWYGKRLNKANPELRSTPELVLDERPADAYRAIYICGVYKRGYPKTNYPHNLHAAILPQPGAQDVFAFENWRLQVRNGLFLPIPAESELPEPYRTLPPAYTTCRIFHWAACFFADRDTSV